MGKLKDYFTKPISRGDLIKDSIGATIISVIVMAAGITWVDKQIEKMEKASEDDNIINVNFKETENKEG